MLSTESWGVIGALVFVIGSVLAFLRYTIRSLMGFLSNHLGTQTEALQDVASALAEVKEGLHAVLGELRAIRRENHRGGHAGTSAGREA